MTFEEKITSMLQERMLPEEAIKEVFAQLVEFQPSMKSRWHEQYEGYPAMILNGVWISAKDIALEWIDKNKPQAFYRSLFL